MRIAAVVSLSLVCALLAFLGAGLVGACGDDCPPQCGDCTACLATAPLPDRPRVSAPTCEARALPDAHSAAPSRDRRRPIEHVPLLAPV